MREKHIQILGILLTLTYGSFAAWLYWAAPKSLEDVSAKAAETIDQAKTKTQVLTNTYEVDKKKFDEGLEAFRAERYLVSRDLFERADKEKRDARTQFYIAYAYYRQGWGRISNDDVLFREGLKRLALVRKLDEDFESKDDQLKLKTPVELRDELEEGLRITASDFNPLRLVRERK